MWGTRYDVVLVDAANKKLAKKAGKMLKKGKSLDEITSKLNEESELNVKIEEGLFEKEDNEFLKENELEEGMSNFIEKNGRIQFALVREIKKPQSKTLDEARGLVISEYQNYLEENWIKALKAEYPIETNQEVLKKVIEILELEG